MKLSILLLLVALPVFAEVLSVFPLRDPWHGLLEWEPSPPVELASWQPWSLPEARVLGLGLRGAAGPLDGGVELEAQSWAAMTLPALGLDLGLRWDGRRIGLRWRGEFLEGESFSALDLLVRLSDPLPAGFRLRLSEAAGEGLTGRGAQGTMVLAWRGDAGSLAWCRQWEDGGGICDWIVLGRDEGDWLASLALGSGPWQGLDLGWRKGPMRVILKSRWHPWLGLSPGLVLEWHGSRG